MEIQRNVENLGFAEAYNQAIRAAPEEYVILLKADTVLDRPGGVEELVTVAERDPAIGAVACKLVFDDEPSRINSAGGMVYWWTGPVDVGFGELDRGAYGKDHQPFAASGGAMLVRRRAFLDVGGFDDRMFAYAEDVDLSWRMRLRGMKIGFAPGVTVRHAFSVTLGPLSPAKAFFTHRNFLRAMIRNYSASTLAWSLPSYAVWTAARVMGSLALERSPSLAAAHLRAIGWNARSLGDTLLRRRDTQATRVVGDREIRASMGPRGFEPLESIRRKLETAHGRARRDSP
jgi:GT2 family glycosyltransferase